MIERLLSDPTIRDIQKVFDRWHIYKACEVGFFLAPDTLDLICYTPRYKTASELHQFRESLDDVSKFHLKRASDPRTGRILLISFADREALDSLTLTRAAYDSRFKWRGKTILRVLKSPVVSERIENVMKEATLEELKSEIDQGRAFLDELNSYATAQNDEFWADMLPVRVRALDALQREYDRRQGYAKIQELAYSLAYRITGPDSDRGFSESTIGKTAPAFEQIWTYINNKVLRGISATFETSLKSVAITHPASTSLLMEIQVQAIEPNNAQPTMFPIENQTDETSVIRLLDNELASVFRAYRLLLSDQKDIKVRVNAFIKRLDISHLEAKRLAQALLALIPEETAKIEALVAIPRRRVGA